MDLTAIITAIVAIYGAGLSTYILIKNSKENKRQLTINLEKGFYTSGQGVSTPMLIISIANPGNRAVTIDSPYIELPDRTTLIWPNPLSDVRFPYHLEEGQRCHVRAKMEEVKGELVKNGHSATVKLTAKIRDRTGKVYSARKPLEFDLNEEVS
jgi:hypothetical protein